MRKRHNGKEFLFAVNIMPDEISCALSGLPDGQYRVLGENRNVEVKSGQLNDRFAGFMTHIYTNAADYPAPVDIFALEAEIARADSAAREAARNRSEKPSKKKQKKSKR